MIPSPSPSQIQPLAFSGRWRPLLLVKGSNRLGPRCCDAFLSFLPTIGSTCFWTGVCPCFWALPARSCLVPAFPAALVEWSMFKRRSQREDRWSWQLWCGWLVCLYVFPVHRQPVLLGVPEPMLQTMFATRLLPLVDPFVGTLNEFQDLKHHDRSPLGARPTSIFSCRSRVGYFM